MLEAARGSAFVFRAKWALEGRWSSPFRDHHHARRAIFVHIPKCAGMGLMKTVFGVEDQMGHAASSAFAAADRKAYFDYFLFSILREPKSRFLSAYRFLRQGGLNEQDKAWGLRHLKWETADEAVQAIETEGGWGPILRWKHFRPQTHFLPAPGDARQPDFLGRQDRMQESIDRIADRLGLGAITARKVNTSRSEAEQLSPASEAILAKLYTADMRLWQSVCEEW